MAYHFSMPGGPPRNFSCPECGAAYKLVRVPKPDSGEPLSNPVFCVSCDYPLSPSDNGFVLKYVMISRSPHNMYPSAARTDGNK